MNLSLLLSQWWSEFECVDWLHKGLSAQEVHLCGEESGIDFVREIAMVTGDDMEVRRYKRLTSLTVLDRAVGKMLISTLGICSNVSLTGWPVVIVYSALRLSA